MSWPRRNPPGYLQVLPRINHLHLKPPNDRRQQAGKLALGESLPDATPGPVQKGQEGIIALGAPAVRVTRTHPPVRIEGLGVRAPELGGGVDRVGADDDIRAFGDELVENGSVVGGFTAGKGNGGVHAESFVTDGVQEGKFVQELGCDGSGSVVGGGKVGTDFLPKAGLDGRVLTEGCDGPRRGRCSSFVACSKEGHELVDEIFFGKVPRGQSDGDDVRTNSIGFLRSVEFLLLLSDELRSNPTYRYDCSGQIAVALDRDQLNKEAGEKKGSNSEDLCLRAWGKYGPINSVEFVVWIVDGVKVMAHARHTNNVKSCATKPII